MKNAGSFYFFLKKLINLFIFGCVGSSLLRAGFSLVAVSRGYSSLWCTGFSLQWLLLLRSMGSRAQAQQLWPSGLVALRHVGSSQTRDRTRVPCTGRWILNHCATREVPPFTLLLCHPQCVTFTSRPKMGAELQPFCSHFRQKDGELDKEGHVLSL